MVPLLSGEVGCADAHLTRVVTTGSYVRLLLGFRDRLAGMPCVTRKEPVLLIDPFRSHANHTRPEGWRRKALVSGP